MAEAEIPFSKRAARRLIQRAFVLAGRRREVRQHIRELRLLTLWALEDWGFAWTLEIDRGELCFDRRLAKHPDMTLTWACAQDFFEQVASDAPALDRIAVVGGTDSRRAIELVYRAFCSELHHLLQNPVDAAGKSLL